MLRFPPTPGQRWGEQNCFCIKIGTWSWHLPRLWIPGQKRGGGEWASFQLQRKWKWILRRVFLTPQSIITIVGQRVMDRFVTPQGNFSQTQPHFVLNTHPSPKINVYFISFLCLISFFVPALLKRILALQNQKPLHFIQNNLCTLYKKNYLSVGSRFCAFFFLHQFEEAFVQDWPGRSGTTCFLANFIGKHGCEAFRYWEKNKGTKCNFFWEWAPMLLGHSRFFGAPGQMHFKDVGENSALVGNLLASCEWPPAQDLFAVFQEAVSLGALIFAAARVGFNRLLFISENREGSEGVGGPGLDPQWVQPRPRPESRV